MIHAPDALSPGRFREVLGLYPTGVVAVTAMEPGGPVGMILGSFGSVSLDPPLVSFMPGKDSASWARLRGLSAYCINVLGQHQADLCRALSSKRPDKFDGVAWSPSPFGAPALAGSIARIDCRRAQVLDAGDHHIVLCRVLALEPGQPGAPLLFHRGALGTFAAVS